MYLEALLLLAWVHLWFLVAVWKRRNDIADTAWGLGFVYLAVVTLWSRGEALDLRSLLVFGILLFWALRLSSFISLRSRGKPEDPRYAAMRQAWGHAWIFQSYLKVFCLQGFFLFVTASPVLYILKHSRDEQGLGIWDVLGLGLSLFGIFYEAIADAQKSRFKRAMPGSDSFVSSGLWARSRHPNYFGEILVWIGFGIVSLGFLPDSLWTWVGPALITFLLVKVTGIPLTEKRNIQKPGYAGYKAKTPALFPRLWH